MKHQKGSNLTEIWFLWAQWTAKLIYHSKWYSPLSKNKKQSPLCTELSFYCGPVEFTIPKKRGELKWFWRTKYSLSHYQNGGCNVSVFFFFFKSIRSFLSQSYLNAWYFFLKQMSAWLEHNANNSGDLHSWTCVQYEQYSRAIYLEAGMKTHCSTAAWNISTKLYIQKTKLGCTCLHIGMTCSYRWLTLDTALQREWESKRCRDIYDEEEHFKSSCWRWQEQPFLLVKVWNYLKVQCVGFKWRCWAAGWSVLNTPRLILCVHVCSRNYGGCDT